MKNKILIFAEINPNVVDGSSIWLRSLLELLGSSHKYTLNFLPLTQIKDTKTLAYLSNIPSVKVVDQFKNLSKKYKDISTQINALDEVNSYDTILIRGSLQLLDQIGNSEIASKTFAYTLEVSQNFANYSSADKYRVQEILGKFPKLLCQSASIKQLYEKLLSMQASRLVLLPPMTPKREDHCHVNLFNTSNTIIYSGKISRDWGIYDLLDSFELLLKRVGYAKLHLYVSKYHVADKHEKTELINRINDNPSISTFESLDRKAVLAAQCSADIAFAFRSIDDEQSTEISTKFMEYLRAKKPIILKPNKIYRDLLGDNYPLFANTIQETSEMLEKVLINNDFYERAVNLVDSAYRKSISLYNTKELEDSIASFATPKRNIIFAGHDFKFIDQLILKFEKNNNFEVVIDKWKSHSCHDEKQSLNALCNADIIFCEWGLGNLKWYSKHKKSSQLLIARIHLQEILNPQYIEEAELDNVDRIIFISPYRRDEFIDKFKFPHEKTRVIYNYVEIEKFRLPKNNDSKLTLGFIGIVPWRKRLDIAIDIFYEIWKTDNSHILRIAGKMPQEYEWMINSPKYQHELYKYQQLFEYIEKLPCKDNIIFDNHITDMPKWFSNIRYLLSSSDFEGSHQAVAESIASGSEPLILSWDGASSLYPLRYIFSKPTDIVNYLLKTSSKPTTSKLLSDYAQSKFDIDLIYKQFIDLILKY